MKRAVSPLRRERLLKGWDQYELSHQSGFGLPYISMFETGRLVPREAEKERLAKALGVSPEKIFPEKE